MKYDEYFTKVHDLIQDLGVAKIYRYDFSDKYDRDEIDFFYDRSGRIIGGEVEAFFLNCPPVKLTWDTGKGKDYIYGQILIESLADVIFGPKKMISPVPKGEEFKGILWFDMHEDDIEERKQYRVFESIEGVSDWVCLKFYAGEPGKVTLHYLTKFDIIDIPLTFDEYVKIAFTSYGVAKRRNLYNPEFYKDPYAVQPELSKLKEILPMKDFDEVIAELQAKFEDM